jgi:hypothetical protein
MRAARVSAAGGACLAVIAVLWPSEARAWSCGSQCSWYEFDCQAYVAYCGAATGACTAATRAGEQQVALSNGSGVPIPEPQKIQLRPFFGDLVDRASVTASALLAGEVSIAGQTLRWGYSGQTFGHRIYLTAPLDPGSRSQLGILAHELTHVRQFERDAAAGGDFSWRYCRGWVDASYSYEGNPYEQEAFGYEAYVMSQLLPFGLSWSSAGPIAGKACVQIYEPLDAGTWNDNYLCLDGDYGVRWSSAGPLADMRCTQLYEGADPNGWADNYVCVPPESPLRFAWSPAGAINATCVRLFEPGDPDTWDDNYLCLE